MLVMDEAIILSINKEKIMNIEAVINETKILNEQLAAISLEALVDGSLSDLVITTRQRINDNIEKIHAATGMELWEITEATYA